MIKLASMLMATVWLQRLGTKFEKLMELLCPIESVSILVPNAIKIMSALSARLAITWLKVLAYLIFHVTQNVNTAYQDLNVTHKLMLVSYAAYHIAAHATAQTVYNVTKDFIYKHCRLLRVVKNVHNLVEFALILKTVMYVLLVTLDSNK